MRVLTILLITLLASIVVADAISSDSSTGTLDLVVVLVDNNLDVKPVPKKRFEIVPKGSDSGERTITTDLEGKGSVDLPPGWYDLLSIGAVQFADRQFKWKVSFEVTAGETTRIELANDNASVAQTRPSGISTEGEIYEKMRHSVVRVMSDDGRGSGFLVSKSGLIVTNHHVIADSDYLAVKFPDGGKRAAQVCAQAPAHDIAVLRVHPDSVSGLPIVRLAEDSQAAPAVSVGERVIAIGSPLTTETILTSGLISKVAGDSIFSDVDINPGNSGGPLLDFSGEAVGITTFGMSGETGPGIAGIIRVSAVLPLLEEAEEVARSSDPPSNRALPEAADYRFSPDLVKKIALARNPHPSYYKLEAGKFNVQLVTPIASAAEILQREQASIEAHKKRMRKEHRRQEEQGEQVEESLPTTEFYEWQSSSENFRSTVKIMAFPEIKMKVGSAFLAGLAGVGAQYRFKADFDRMELLRDGQPIEPIHPGKFREVIDEGGAVARITDVVHFGVYEYPPEAFLDGANLELRIWKQGVTKPIVTPISSVMRERVMEDFVPYFQEVGLMTREDPSEADKLDARVMGYLNMLRGWTTAAEIANALQLPVAEIETSLERCAGRHRAESRVSGDEVQYKNH